MVAKRVGIIGHGAITRILTSTLIANDPEGLRVQIVGILVREARVSETCTAAEVTAPAARVVSSVPALLALKPTVVVECAGQDAVRQYGTAVLGGGADLMVISSGALADDSVRDALVAAVATERAAGAIAGLDGLGALRMGGLDAVTYTSTKPPDAWRGTPAEHEFDLAALTERTVIFSGPAAEAAREYPKNANLAATVAFAGLGLQRTMVRLVADPAAEHNTGRINAKGTFGTLTVECVNHPAAGNPKTSASTGLSLAHALLRGSEPIVI
eukprot:CAMPEP_0181220810 /NCGR_PEP_ID=MMETSP1096-20121128/29041_1 /TAXON_ID=156174 ORGANISM="Chrysochromulina ericina, Strain CCMP281" /NCGR_SAMPLE_ID=MMETSP1096 /ASSEMBLY_ACC=CAM_ASM_000453 /LENGTH=270 /DNA_ID=CAMNT_0023313349 /DNA_START=173 /DNA_END=986 /DNA_ORIENTATION=-